MAINQRTARVAGFVYMVVVVSSIFGQLYVPSRITAPGDALATATNIVANEALYRAGMASAMIATLAFLLLPFALYKLLETVDRQAAVLMVVFAVASSPLALVALAYKLDALWLLGDAEYLQAFTTEQVHAQAMLALRSGGNAIRVAELFWGLWLLPFGYLTFRSGFLPRLLGVLLFLGGLGYMIKFFGRLLIAEYPVSALSFLLWPAHIGEVGIALWLLILGTRSPRVRRTAPAKARYEEPDAAELPSQSGQA